MFIVIVIVALVIATLIVFEPKFDRNTETGKIILWYNHNHERKFLEL